MILNEEQIDELKEKNETSLDERPLSRQECRDLIRTIKSQQQTIDKQRKVLDKAEEALEQMQGDLGDIESKYDIDLIKGHVADVLKQIAEVEG